MLGLYQPDAIATYTVNGDTYAVSVVATLTQPKNQTPEPSADAIRQLFYGPQAVLCTQLKLCLSIKVLIQFD